MIKEKYWFRKKSPRSIKKRVLIVADWKNTEPSYFKLLHQYLRENNLLKEDVLGIESVWFGTNTCSTIEKWIKEFKKRWYHKNNDELWVVIDWDPKRSDANHFENFKQAFSRIENSSEKFLHWVFSYEAFEYWLLLHLRDHDGSHIERTEYEKLINRGCGDELYSKEKIGEIWWWEVSEKLFKILMQDNGLNKAIERAEKIHIQNGIWNPQHEKQSDLWSCTNVYKLINRLKKSN